MYKSARKHCQTTDFTGKAIANMKKKTYKGLQKPRKINNNNNIIIKNK